MATATLRASEESARNAIDDFLFQQFGEVPGYSIDADGERCWSFWIIDEDTTSYVHPDLRIEWYGTAWTENARE